MIGQRVHPIGLGDLIHAIGSLNASDDEAMKIAVMVGMFRAEAMQTYGAERTSGEDAAVEGITGTATAMVRSGRSPTTEVIDGTGSSERPPPGHSSGATDTVTDVAISDDDLTLTSLGTVTPPARSWISEVKELPEPAPAAALPYDASVPPFVSLLAPSITRAVLTEAAATWTRGGPIDLDRLVYDVARRQPVRALPCLRATTLRRGAQILIDRATSMQPFQIDADNLAARIQEITSHGATQLLYFDEDPTIVDGTWPVSEGRPHELPPAGTPIIVITDLGIRNLRSGRPRVRRYWLTFADRAMRRGCPVIGFVPYPSSRWPSGLHGLVALVLWDRKTTVATVRSARRGENR